MVRILRGLGLLVAVLLSLAACAPASNAPTVAPLPTATPLPVTPSPFMGGLQVQSTSTVLPTSTPVELAVGLPAGKPVFLDSFANW